MSGFEEKVKEAIQEEGLRAALLNMRVEPKTAVVSAVEPVVEEIEAAVGELSTEAGTAAVVDSEPVLLEDDILHTPAGEDEALMKDLAAVEVTGEVDGEEHQNKWYARGVLGVVGKWVSYAGGQVDDAFSEQVIYIKKYEFATALLGSMGLGAFLSALISLIWNKL